MEEPKFTNEEWQIIYDVLYQYKKSVTDEAKLKQIKWIIHKVIQSVKED